GRGDVDPAPQGFNVLADDVHADAATGNIADLLSRREAGVEDELVDLGIGQLLTRLDAAVGYGLAKDAFLRQAAAVVRDFDDDAAGFVSGMEADHAGCRLAGGDAKIRRLDAVVGRVADHVDQRIADGG